MAITERKLARILIVDDEVNIRTFLSQALEDEGYAVTVASDGYEAMREARESPPDLILLDLMMPLLDGRTFLDIYRHTPGPKAPIVVITADRSKGEDMEDNLAAAVVHKPFSIDRLLTIVRRHLEYV